MTRLRSSSSEGESGINSTVAFTVLLLPVACVWLILLLLTDFNPLAVCPGLVGILYVLGRTA